VSILIVTGTSTDVGKTVVTAAIAALATGSVAVVKPARTGVAPGARGDLAEVTRLSGCTDVHEYARYPEPLSPHTAARRSGLAALTMGDVAMRISDLDVDHDLVIVEGAGGLLVPFADDPKWTLRDLAFSLRAPVVLVTAAGLGTLNHTALTLEAMDGLDLAGVVLGSWPAAPGLAERCNAADLFAMVPQRFAGAVPEGAAQLGNFRRSARPWLGSDFGGTFDGAAFVASVVRQET